LSRDFILCESVQRRTKYYKSAFPLAVIPLLFFHVGQLILDTFIADRIRARPKAAQ
jgi:hypothetical protein